MAAEKNLKIIYAEDNMATRMINAFVTRQVFPAPCTVLEAVNAVKAFKLYEDNAPVDLVLSDFQMGGNENDGDSLLRKIIEYNKAKGLPDDKLPVFLFISGSQGEVTEAIETYGPNSTDETRHPHPIGFINKEDAPFSDKVLITALREQLNSQIQNQSSGLLNSFLNEAKTKLENKMAATFPSSPDSFTEKISESKSGSRSRSGSASSLSSVNSEGSSSVISPAR